MEVDKYLYSVLYGSSPSETEGKASDRPDPLTLDNFEEHFFSLLLEKASDCEKPGNDLDKNPFDFIVSCYIRSFGQKTPPDCEAVPGLLRNYAKLLLTNPEVVDCPFSVTASIQSQLPVFSIGMQNLITSLAESMDSSELPLLLKPLIKAVMKTIGASQLPGLVAEQVLNSLIHLIKSSGHLARCLAELILENTSRFPADMESNLLGNLISKSYLPSWRHANFAFPSELDSELDISNNAFVSKFQTVLTTYNNKVFGLIRSFLNYASCRDLIISWVVLVLAKMEFKGRDASMVGYNYQLKLIGDGALCNLLVVLLSLAQPICKPEAIVKVDEHYAVCRHCRIKSLSEETMTRKSDNPTVCQCGDDQKPGFSTECFYLCHVCMQLSLRRLLSIYKGILTDSGITRDFLRVWRESYGRNPLFEMTEQRFKESIVAMNHILITLKMPDLLSLLTRFMCATCNWLLLKIDKLETVPELIVENVNTLVMVLESCSETEVLEALDCNTLYPLYKCIVALMQEDSPIRNPHLKAHLAQCLSALLPQAMELKAVREECMTMLRDNKISITKAVLHVFVTIEQTGQSVSFEEKFHYRVSLHQIICYLFCHACQSYRHEFQDSAHYAFTHMDDVNPPIFLRFINLLLNDANFLMDETFIALTEVREVQNADSSQLESSNELIGRLSMCRYRCLLNSKTLETLRLLTTTIVNIFCHETIVDRIATMMNYFLDKLTGPEQRNLRIKDKDRVGFDPKALLANIIAIMTNLGRHENFVKACAKDRGRYPEGLYDNTADILARIGSSPTEIEKFRRFASNVAEKMKLYQEEEMSYDDAPEEFVDQITGELMNDPVRLPVSKRILDRVTITRHLLSDQTDPFNRLPLEIKDLIPETELKAQIEEWKKRKKNEN